MRCLVEDLHQVSARLLLHQYGRNEELKISNGNPRNKIQHQLEKWQSEVLLIRSVLEFCSQWFRNFSRDDFYCGSKSLSRAKTPGHEINCLWKKVRKAAEPTLSHLSQ